MQMKLIVTLLVLAFLALYLLPAAAMVAVIAVLIGSAFNHYSQGSLAVLAGAFIGAWWAFGIYFASFLLVGFIAGPRLIQYAFALADFTLGHAAGLRARISRE